VEKTVHSVEKSQEYSLWKSKREKVPEEFGFGTAEGAWKGE
jgi:hypothetical protein